MIRKLLGGLVVVWLLFAAVWVVASGFTRNEVMLNAACDPTRELWRDLNAAFIADYEQTNGVKLSIRQSHGGSGSASTQQVNGRHHPAEPGPDHRHAERLGHGWHRRRRERKGDCMGGSDCASP